jgi:soluble lytic murein transglycosylase-like protein
MIENSIKQFRAKRNANSNRVGTLPTTKQRLGLAQREIARSENETSRSLQQSTVMQEAAYNPEEKISKWADEMDSLRAERVDRDQSTTNALSVMPGPEPRYQREFTGSVTPPEDIKANTGFTSAVDALASKYNISADEVYSVIQGESAFNPTAQNASGATGLFQFIPSTAEELGTTTEAILRMSPVEQVALYDKYLQRWEYTGDNRLGIMQAAPAFASRASGDTIYDTDSAAWRQNPGWRSLGDGPITVESINSYYAKQGNT